MKRVICQILFILLSMILTSCATVQQPVQEIGETGSVVAQAEWPDDVPSGVVTVRMTISASDMETVSQDFDFSGERGEIYGIYGVAAGDGRSVVLEGITSDNRKIFKGSLSDFSVVPGQVADSGLIAMSPVRDIPLAQAVIGAEGGNGQVVIRWDSVAGAASYNIYMNGAPGASKKNFDARKNTTSNSFTWTGLENGTTYYFVVTAENSSGESEDSNEVDATPDVAPAKPAAVRGPAIPTNVNAEAGDSEVTITWNRVSGAESYGIYMNMAPGASKKNFDARKSSTANSYTWTRLKNGTTYSFVVTAENSYGESNDSKEISATPGTGVAVPEVPVAVPEVPVEVPEVPEVPVKAPEVPVKAAKVPVKVPDQAPVAEGPLTPQKLLMKADDIRAPGKNFVQELKITFKKGDNESVNETLVRVKDFKKSLVIYKYPPTQKGRVILMVETNMWIYFPGTKKPVRISPAQQLLGQVSNADVARVVYNFDYNAVKVEEDNTGKEKLLKLFLKAKTSGAAYGSINLWMEKGSYKLVKAEFFTLSGRLLKTIYYKGYKHMLGKERPTILEVHDAIKTTEVTIMEYTDMKVEDTPDNYFQKTFMQRIPRLYP